MRENSKFASLPLQERKQIMNEYAKEVIGQNEFKNQIEIPENVGDADTGTDNQEDQQDS